MLQRALVRQEVPLRYSQGFNPRPRLSLPLPRSVGVCSDDEVLCALVDLGEDYDLDVIAEDLSHQLPDECKVSSVMVRDSKVTLQPQAASYSFPLKECAINDDFLAGFQGLEKAADGEMPIMVSRRASKRKTLREVDVSQYVGSVKMEDGTVTVNCTITQGGSIRIDELMEQMSISAKDLSGPIKRASVEWSEN
jgi:radical SAM-linked protein